MSGGRSLAGATLREGAVRGPQFLEPASPGTTGFFEFTEEYVWRLAERDPLVEDHFTTYFSDLLRIKLRGRLRTQDAIDEVRQETFFRVLKKLRDGGLQHPERLGAFVNSVCNYVLFERFREQDRYQPMDLPEPVDAAADLDAPFVDEERKRLVETVLGELPRRDRKLLRLLFLEERDKEDVCRRMGVTDSYLRVLLHRAKRRFREISRQLSGASVQQTGPMSESCRNRNGRAAHCVAGAA